MKDKTSSSLSDRDLHYLQRCLTLAKKGSSKVFPNPQVGAVIVHNDRIIGEGFHAFSGGPHAEINALNSVSELDVLSQSTMYVSLEPCSHYGKTPPCVVAIQQHKIPRVVIGCLDPNPQVSGRGVQCLLDAHITVDLAPDPTPFQQVNRAFFLNQQQQIPWIILKWAESSDGFIAAYNKNREPSPTPITGPEANAFVHKIRSQSHAIMVGRRTASIDNPSLTTRRFYGDHPIRIVFDRHLHLPPSLQLFQDGHRTIVLNGHQASTNGPLTYFVPGQWTDLRALAKELYAELKICSILVEGGSHILQQFLDQNFWNEIFRFQSSTPLHSGVKAPNWPEFLPIPSFVQLGQDRLFELSRS